jgi:glycosyltransferase involved in cell wall biosynthesis
MQVLLVSAEFGWPTNTGYRQRLAGTARALATLGRLTWVVCTPRTDDPGPPPADLPVDVRVVPLRRRSGAGTKLRWPASGRPWRLHSLDLPAMRRDVRAAVAGRGPFDIVFVAQMESWAVVEPLLPDLVADRGIHALDIDDVEQHKVRGRAVAEWANGGVRGRARALARFEDARRWRRVVDHAVDATTTFTASELDRHRLGDRPVVLRNVVPEPPPGYVRAASDEPTLVFVGSLTYEPNVDALERFVADVLPAVRRAVPDAVLRIVGQGREPRVERLAAAPGVVLVGEVPAVSPELARAAAAVVPLRFGGGTRIKILEALAHGVPVVSTTAGAEGLGLRNGEHALIADTPDELAAACVRLLVDRAEGERLAAQGAGLVAPHRAEVVRAGLIAELQARHRARSASTSA